MSKEIRILNRGQALVDPNELNLASVNPNQGDIGALCSSYTEIGFWGDVIVRQDTNEVLAGNHRVMAARSLDMPEIPVQYIEVDGDDHALQVMLADNRTRDLATTDEDQLAILLKNLADKDMLLGTGFDGDDLDDLLTAAAEDDGRYTNRVKAPIYEITGEKPPVEDLYDEEKVKELVAEIQAANLDPHIQHFLIRAAERHTVFHFDKIAEFYAHSDPDVQELMERSALVIIDFDKAIQEGFVQLSQRIEAIYNSEEYEQE